MIVNRNKNAVTAGMKHMKKAPQGQVSQEPVDGFQQSNQTGEKPGYGANLLSSTAKGAIKGGFYVAEKVDNFLGSLYTGDGLDKPGLHILSALTGMACGVVFGVIPGAIYGFAKGVFGGTVDISNM